MYTIVYNTPGHMPTMDPFEVQTASDALMALCIELERYGMEVEDEEVATAILKQVSEMESDQNHWIECICSNGGLSFEFGDYVFEVNPS